MSGGSTLETKIDNRARFSLRDHFITAVTGLVTAAAGYFFSHGSAPVAIATGSLGVGITRSIIEKCHGGSWNGSPLFIPLVSPEESFGDSSFSLLKTFNDVGIVCLGAVAGMLSAGYADFVTPGLDTIQRLTLPLGGALLGWGAGQITRLATIAPLSLAQGAWETGRNLTNRMHSSPGLK